MAILYHNKEKLCGFSQKVHKYFFHFCLVFYFLDILGGFVSV